MAYAILSEDDEVKLMADLTDLVVDTVLLYHPNRPAEPPVSVANTGEALTPYMASGYSQFRHPATDIIADKE